MKIVFDKIGSTAKPFELEVEGTTMVGTLQKCGYHRIQLDALLKGAVELVCDRCGSHYQHLLDTPLRLKLSDQLIEQRDDLDSIEFLDGVIDLHYILESEINTLQGAYHYCEPCSSSDEDFEREF